MPIISSSYNPSFLFKNGHFSTVFVALTRKIADFEQKREKLELADGDFLGLDWSLSETPTNKVVILLHGLEGNAQRAYIKGSAKLFNAYGYDVCAVNFRSCSGETNRLFRSYHSGATEDLEAVVHHILTAKKYTEIFIKGFSMGGNLALKYLGERTSIPKEIKAAVAISVPCSLHSSLKQLLTPKNVLYANRFKKHLVEKLWVKHTLFPDKISANDIKNVKTLKDFDDIYTSRAHGFKDALDYYKQSSCLQFLSNINIPILIINAKNDSFLGAECYPQTEAEQHKKLYLEMLKYGGHVGFSGANNISYTEKRALDFCNEVV